MSIKPTAKKCPVCYKYDSAMKSLEKATAKQKENPKPLFGVYFARQAHKMPEFCEETGQRLPTYPEWLKRSCMAHILPKRKNFGFESVALHPMNMIFIMPDVHNHMDNFGEEYIVKMKMYPIIKERVKILLPFLIEKERNKVPEYLL